MPSRRLICRKSDKQKQIRQNGARAALGHGEKNSQRAYFVSIASISGIPRCSRAGLSRAISGPSHSNSEARSRPKAYASIPFVESATRTGFLHAPSQPVFELRDGSSPYDRDAAVLYSKAVLLA